MTFVIPCKRLRGCRSGKRPTGQLVGPRVMERPGRLRAFRIRVDDAIAIVGKFVNARLHLRGYGVGLLNG